MTKLSVFLAVLFAVLNFVFAGINYYRINQIYDNLDVDKKLKDLKEVKDYSFHIIIIFALQLITIIYTSIQTK